MSVTAENQGGARQQRSRMFGWTVRVAGVVIMLTVVAAAIISMVSSRAGTPGTAVASKSAAAPLGVLVFPRDSDGGYYVDADVNGRQIRFVVDPSSRATVLGRDDAQSVGVDTYDLKFTDRVATAGGEASAALVTVRELRIKTLTLFDAKLEITDKPLPNPIAGKSFLDRFSSYELQQDKLVLRQ